VAPTAGAVVRLRFARSAGRAAILGISRADGQPVPFGAELSNEQGQSIGTVAQAGHIIARGLKSDTGELVANWGDGAGEQCAVDYALPKVDGKSTAYSVAKTVCR
jgi:outer membrane usher protein